MLRCTEKKAVKPLKITIDIFSRYDLVDLFDRCGVTIGRQARAFLAVQLFDFKIAIVESVGEMGGGSTRHTTATQTIIQHYNRSPFLCEQVRCCQPGDTRTDDTNIGAYTLFQPGLRRRVSRRHPE